MSTSINITVDSGNLTAAVKLVQSAARQAQQQKEAEKILETKATKERNDSLLATGGAGALGGAGAAGTGVRQPTSGTSTAAKTGKDLNGKPLFGAPITQPQINRRPTARRDGRDAISMSWIVIGSNDWYGNILPGSAGIIRATQPTYTGTNSGRSLYISSTDGSSWFSLDSVPGTSAPGGFGSGDSTSFNPSAEFDSSNVYRLDSGVNDCVFDLFPAGRGAFVAIFRFTLGYFKSRWDAVFNPDTSGFDYTPGLAVRSELNVFYRSFLVSTSAVKEIETPQGAKDYFDRKFPGMIETSRTLRRYVGDDAGGFIIERRTSPDPDKSPVVLDYGTVPAFDIVQGSLNFNGRGSKGLWWLNGWWQSAMPIAADNEEQEFIVHGSPAIYSRVLNEETDWPNYFEPIDANGVVNNNGTSWLEWLEASYEQDQSKMIKPLAYYVASYLDIFNEPMSVEMPIYQAISAVVEGYSWVEGISPRIPPTNTNYWRSLKTLSFGDTAPMPVPPTLTVPSSQDRSTSTGNYFCVTTDWGSPAFCRAQLLSLGFTAADLTPDPPPAPPP